MSMTGENRVLTDRHRRPGTPVRADSPRPVAGRYGPLSDARIGHGPARIHTQVNLEKEGHHEDRERSDY